MLFLYPLMLQAYRGVPFQPWLRGSLEGIAPADCRACSRGATGCGAACSTHVVLHARLERRYAAIAGARGQARAAQARASEPS